MFYVAKNIFEHQDSDKSLLSDSLRGVYDPTKISPDATAPHSNIKIQRLKVKAAFRFTATVKNLLLTWANLGILEPL